MTVDKIIEYMLASVPNEYDTSVGSFFYDLLYPVAEQVYRLQSDISLLEKNAFALTAVGEYLDRKVAEQGITRKQATFAKGTVRITGDVGAVIPKGAKVAAGDILFAVDKDTVISDSGYADVTATCVVRGSVGNVSVGQINHFPVTLPKLTDVSNISAFTGGYDEESDSELLQRYLEKVSRPNISGNKYHYIEWAKEITGVGDVQVIPLWNGVGTLKVIITDTNNQPANVELISEVQTHIDENKPIGANITVASATPLKINISVELFTSSNVQTDIETAISDYLSDASLKKLYISYAKIGSLILSVSGVDDYANLKVNGGTANISIPAGSVPVLGSVVIT